MADNFNLRAFLAENKLTKNAQLLNERDTSRPGTDFDFIQGPEGDPLVSKVLGYLEQNYEEGVDFEYDPNMQRLAIYGDLAEDGELVDLIDDVVTQPEYEDNLEEADWRNNPYTPHNFDGVARQAQQSKELQATANRMFPEFGGELKDLGAPLTPEQRNAVWATWSKEKTQKESMNSKKQDMKETKLTAKELRLVEMVNSAMREEEEGNTFYRRGGDDEIPNPPAELHIPKELTSEDEMADETVIPEYNTIDELMNSIDHGTNKVAEEHKMQEMKKIAEALRMKAKKMEESEHAAHISPKDLKQLAIDAAKLEKAAEKLKLAFDKKFNKKEKPAAAPKAEKVEALQEGTFDLRKFLAENRK